MTLELDIRFRHPGFTLEVTASSHAGTTGLFGPSGAGKSTLVAVIGGLLQPTDGRIVFGGQTLFDSARGIDVPVHRRRLGHVFQEGRLFPHLTVHANLLYARRFVAADGVTLDHIADLLDIGPLLTRHPRNLSGGERQRVALGRALLSSPRGLLMDEPLASLDEARKQEILPYFERLRDESRLPTLYVSHAAAEVERLAATTVVLSDGAVAASGATRDVLTSAAPRGSPTASDREEQSEHAV